MGRPLSGAALANASVPMAVPAPDGAEWNNDFDYPRGIVVGRGRTGGENRRGQRNDDAGGALR